MKRNFFSLFFFGIITAFPLFLEAEDVLKEPLDTLHVKNEVSPEKSSLVLEEQKTQEKPSSENTSPQELLLSRLSLIQDLTTSNYYELVNWCVRLGLDSKGDVLELRQRIANYLELDLTKKDTQKSSQILTIDAAKEANFLNVEGFEGKKVIRISGGIQVTLIDNNKNMTNIIQADELWYDQEQEEMTAQGNVIYTLERGSSKEVFKGESITFQISDSQGVFFEGNSTRKHQIEGQTLDFSYKGQEIKRLGDDVVIMTNGVVTSSPSPSPNYQIRAHKIWALAPGEWGLKDAVLYIGRIPVFYFPFYFQPGDDFFFNPVLGLVDSNDRRGTYLQTTTYFLGKKKKKTPSFLLCKSQITLTKKRLFEDFLWFAVNHKNQSFHQTGP